MNEGLWTEGRLCPGEFRGLRAALIAESEAEENHHEYSGEGLGFWVSQQGLQAGRLPQIPGRGHLAMGPQGTGEGNTWIMCS